MFVCLFLDDASSLKPPGMEWYTLFNSAERGWQALKFVGERNIHLTVSIMHRGEVCDCTR